MPQSSSEPMKRVKSRPEPLMTVAAKDLVSLVSRRLLAHKSFDPRRTRAEEWAGIPLLRRLADDTEANIDDFSDEICQAITQHLLHLALYPADFPRVFDREALIDTASPAERTRVLLTRMADNLAWMADLAAKSHRPPRS